MLSVFEPNDNFIGDKIYMLFYCALENQQTDESVLHGLFANLHVHPSLTNISGQLATNPPRWHWNDDHLE